MHHREKQDSKFMKSLTLNVSKTGDEDMLKYQ